MDQKGMIDDIVARVLQKVAAMEPAVQEPAAQEPVSDIRPGLLVLTQKHGETCHTFFDCEALNEHYRIACALQNDYQVDLNDYEVVIMMDLTVEVLGKLASGIYDTPYTKTAAQAILMGKRIFVPVEEVELFRYAATAPAPYYAMLQQKLNLLQDSGVALCKLEDVAGCILDEQACACQCQTASPSVPCRTEEEKEYRLNKRVITERDLVDACAAKVSRVCIPSRSIVTDLAKEYAKERDIRLIRE